jgi:shikimate dehydrogenase
VVDLVYGQGTTSLVEAANTRGAVAIDGKAMLVMQAALAYQLWTGVQPPIDAMRASAERGER